MDAPSSGEEPILKARKPYTITKQRERWTEEEHNRFLEALKLYGRAWQRIEEHIGTKTAVQIRSHAQKFFTKLEKEANFKGIPVGQALDIEIPPPRPKRKPSIPYPRKLGNTHLTSPVGSRNEKSGTSVSYAPLSKDTLDKSEILPEIAGDEKFESATTNQENNTSGRSCVLQVHPGTLSSSVTKNSSAPSGSRMSCAFKDFDQNLEEVNLDEVNETYDTIEASNGMSVDKVDINKSFQEKNVADYTSLTNPLSKEDNCSQDAILAWDELKLKDEVQKVTSHPRHVPVNVVDSSLGRDAPVITPHMAYHEPIMHLSDGAHPKTCIDHSTSVNSEHCTSTSNVTINQPFPCLHPFFPPTRSQDDHQSFIHASSTFANLLVSTLLQNPAAHAAASFAASFWPHTSMEATACISGGFPAGSINAVPSMAAIAAATVASATAWWAAHGLLPLCVPYQMGPSYAPSSVPPLEVNLSRAHDIERRKEANDPTSQNQQIRPELSEALQGQHVTLKSPDSEESNALKCNHGMTVIETDQCRIDPEVHDSDKLKGRKQVDRSSCGSNSSSEVDTDGLEKQEKNKEEVGVPALNNPVSDAGRRARSSSCSSDSWKEVSKEGRLAFQALFSRQVLPQSFSPPYDSKVGESMTEINQQSANGIDDERSEFCLNSKMWLNCSGNQEVEQNAYHRAESCNKEEGLLATRRSKVRCTGFKPYKRCSSEAKESWGLSANGSQDQEKYPKRVRLEGAEGSA